MTAVKNVLIVDDEAMLRESVSAFLKTKGYGVYEAENGKDALDILSRRPVALVLLDLMLPGLPGEEVCRAIRRQSRVPIIMLTAKAAEQDLLDGLMNGADDYVTKPFSVLELYARMEAVLRRAGDELKPLAQRFSWDGDDLVIDLEHDEVYKQGRRLSLTGSEWRILLALVRHPGKTFSREALIDLVYGPAFDGFDRAIDTHIKNLRKKMETDPKAPRYIRTVHGMGYRFGGNEP